MAEFIEVAKLVWTILGPVVTAMVERGLSGKDPRDVLRDARIADILPPQSATELAMLLALAAKAGAK